VSTEIERKFLVTSDDWRKGAKGLLYVQGYISNDKSRVVRVRIGGDDAFLTLKGAPASDGISRSEHEYKIPKKDAEEMLNTLCLPGKIEKMRYKVPFGGLVWEIDEFKGANAGLIVAEVELPASNHPVALPPWAGAEVSHDARYSNAELSKTPYSSWNQKAEKCRTPKH
jgi:adenylate cyclase